MLLITILLYAVAALTVLTGISVLCGTTKQSKLKGVWFALATLGTAVWSAAIALFLSLPESSASLAPAIVVGIITGITLTDISLLGYASWENARSGKLVTFLSALGGAAIVGLLAFRPELFYSNITFGDGFNIIHTVRSWYFYVIIAYFTLVSVIYTNSITKGTERIKSRGAKLGLKIFQAGLSLGGILALVFDLLLLTSHPNLVWIGPMAVSVTITIFYYSVVKYRILAVSGKWMQILSYILLVAVGVVLYFLIFYAIFTSLFRISSPSPQIILLNLIMVIIVLCLMPALSEVSAMIKALLPTRQINIGYITKKLDALKKNDLDLKELAGFLAQHLKLDYFGFYVNGHLYGSKNLDLPATSLVKLEKLKLPTHGIWQPVDDSLDLGEKIFKVAALFDNKNHVFGQVLLGRSSSGHVLERRDLVKIEMVVNLCACLVSGDKSL